jgi:arylsulfatase A-like enzyme
MNVVLVVVDTLRRDALSPYSDEANTLAVQSIADRSRVFSDFSATSCWTMPTHASMFTGVYPTRHRAMEPRVHLSEDVPMVGEALQSAGFTTHAINIPHPLSGNAGFNRGWDEYQNTYKFPKHRQMLRLLDTYVSDGISRDPLNALRSEYRSALRPNYRTQHAIDDVVDRVNRDGDRFVFTNLFSVHADYKPFPRHAPDVSEDAEKLGELTRSDEGHHYRHRYNYGTLSEELPEGVVDETHELYNGEVQWVDENLGRLWDALEREDRLEDTAVIITADHGELFGEGDGVPLDHRNSLHPVLLDVPLLLYHPDLDAGTDDRLASQVDVAPTILDAAGVDADWDVDGLSLLSDRAHDVVFAEHGPQEFRNEYLLENWDIDATPYEIERKAARTKAATVRFRNDDTVRTHDRAQQGGVSDEERSRLRELVDDRLEWVGAAEGPADAVTDDVRERLRDIGYLG